MGAQLTPEELKEFQSFRVDANRFASILGELHYQRTLVDLELENVKLGVKENARKQQINFKVLGEKYGDGSINLETGEITKVQPS